MTVELPNWSTSPGPERDLGHRGAVQERAVGAAQVGVHEHAQPNADLAVVARNLVVGQDDVVVERPAQADRARADVEARHRLAQVRTAS